MKLYEAFITMQPIAPSASGRDRMRLQEAGRLMLYALNEQARIHMPTSRHSEADRDSAVQTVLFRLIKAGPRGARAGDPVTDDAIKRWLGRAIRNAVRDQHRRAKRQVEADARVLGRQAHAMHGPGSGGTRRVTERRINDAIELERARLIKEIIPAVAQRKARSSKAAGQRFLDNVKVLAEAVRAGRTVVDLAKDELSADGVVDDGTKQWCKALTTRRTALDKRFQRVREHIIAEIDEMRDQSKLDRRQRAIQLLIVQQRFYLQRRTDAVIAKAHSGKRRDDKTSN